jgi:hypothetical protein
MPNPSIERTSQGLRPCAASHVNVRRHEVSAPWEHGQYRNTKAVAIAAPFDSKSKRIPPNSRGVTVRSAARKIPSWSKCMKVRFGYCQAKSRSPSTSSTRRLHGTTSARCVASTRFTASGSHRYSHPSSRWRLHAMSGQSKLLLLGQAPNPSIERTNNGESSLRAFANAQPPLFASHLKR